MNRSFAGLAIFALLAFSSLSSSESLSVTPEHPFLLNGTWVEAQELKEGDILTTLDGNQVRITGLTTIALKEPIAVYNLEAGFFHDFVVGPLGLVAHNSNTPLSRVGQGQSGIRVLGAGRISGYVASNAKRTYRITSPSQFSAQREKVWVMLQRGLKARNPGDASIDSLSWTQLAKNSKDTLSPHYQNSLKYALWQDDVDLLTHGTGPMYYSQIVDSGLAEDLKFLVLDDTHPVFYQQGKKWGGWYYGKSDNTYGINARTVVLPRGSLDKFVTSHELGHFAMHINTNEAALAALGSAHRSALTRNVQAISGYSLTNERELFAEGTAMWFGFNPANGEFIGFSEARALMKTKNAGLHDLMYELYGTGKYWKDPKLMQMLEKTASETQDMYLIVGITAGVGTAVVGGGTVVAVGVALSE